MSGCRNDSRLSVRAERRQGGDERSNNDFERYQLSRQGQQGEGKNGGEFDETVHDLTLSAGLRAPAARRVGPEGRNHVTFSRRLSPVGTAAPSWVALL